MKIMCLSDTHGFHDNIEISLESDIIVITGDFQKFGTKKELVHFNRWLGFLPAKYKIVIAGNHDRTAYLQEKKDTKEMFTNAIYLQDEEVVIDGIKFYGMPWTPKYYNWYFMVGEGELGMLDKCSKIPVDTDVLLTHGPPRNKLDWSPTTKRHIGSIDLREKIEKIKPKLHIFGHNHSGYGGIRNEHTQFINASICTEQYKPTNRPIYIDI